MDPSRKRTIRFVVALSAAAAAGRRARLHELLRLHRSPAAVRARDRPAQPGKKYQLVGKVVAGYKQQGDTTYFDVRDRNGKASVPVTYRGTLPDPFRADREIVVDVVKKGDVYEGQTGSLVTKCPSKFTADKTDT